MPAHVLPLTHAERVERRRQQTREAQARWRAKHPDLEAQRQLAKRQRRLPTTRGYALGLGRPLTHSEASSRSFRDPHPCVYQAALDACLAAGRTTPYIVAVAHYGLPSAYDRDAVADAMHRMVKRGELIRVKRGWYDRPGAAPCASKDRVLEAIGDGIDTMNGLRRWTGLSESSVRHWIKQLRDEGVPIRRSFRVENRARSCRYCLFKPSPGRPKGSKTKPKVATS